MDAKMKKLIFFSLILCLFACGAVFAEDDFDRVKFPEPALGKKPVKDQVKTALEAYRQMSEAELWDKDFFRENHYKVIDECPDTPWAIESCWRLSNLLLSDSSQVDQAEIIRLMEHALEKYPGNPWQERFKNRLLVTLENTQNHKLMLFWCQKFLENTDPASEKYLSLSLSAGKAAKAAGDQQSAEWYFNEVIEKSPDQQSVFARSAQSYFER